MSAPTQPLPRSATQGLAANLPAWRASPRAQLLSLLLVTAATHVHFFNVTFDDAFISFRYAENLARGHGLVFNVGERVEGYSNFLWTTLLALFAKAGFDRSELGLLVTAKVLGATFDFATVGLLWRMSGGERGRSLLAPLYLAALPSFAIWGVSGLETPLVTFLLLVTVYLHLQEDAALAQGRSAPPLSYLALAAAALTRPEPVLLFAPLVALRWVRHGRPRLAKITLPRELAYLLLFGVPYGAFLGFRLAYYGELLPNTYYAKMVEDPEVISRGARYLRTAARDLGWWWLVPWGLFALGAGRRSSHRTTTASVFLGLLLLVVWREGGDWMPAQRLLVPALPFVALLVEGVRQTLSDLPSRRLVPSSLPSWVAPPSWLARLRKLDDPTSAHRLRVALLALFSVSLALGVFRQYERAKLQAPSGFAKIELAAGVHYEAARWMARELPPTSLLALGEAGLVPYLTRLPVLDLFGLTDRHLARQPGALHRKFDVEYVLERDPDYVFLLAQQTPEGVLYSDHHHATVLLAEPRFRQRYEVLREFRGAVLFARASRAATEAK